MVIHEAAMINSKEVMINSKAMKAMPGSPKQKAISKQIDQYRKELGLDEAFETAICLVEWPDRLGDLTPAEALRIELTAASGKASAEFRRGDE